MNLSQPFFTNKENYIYYRNLFIRFVKTTKQYNWLKTKYKTISELDRELKYKIPEHYCDMFVLQEFTTLDYLIFLAKNVMPKHRNIAAKMAYDILYKFNVKEEDADYYIKYHRENCGFKQFKNTVFDDNNINSFKKLTEYAPLSLIFFYMGNDYCCKIPRLIGGRKFIDDWMCNVSKTIYNF